MRGELMKVGRALSACAPTTLVFLRRRPKPGHARSLVRGAHERAGYTALAFAKRGGDFPAEHAVLDPHGFYSVRHSLAIMRCEIYDIVTAGDHDLVIGEVVHFESSPGEPLIFHRGAFGGLDEDALVPRGRVIGISDGEGWM